MHRTKFYMYTVHAWLADMMMGARIHCIKAQAMCNTWNTTPFVQKCSTIKNSRDHIASCVQCKTLLLSNQSFDSFNVKSINMHTELHAYYRNSVCCRSCMHFIKVNCMTNLLKFIRYKHCWQPWSGSKNHIIHMVCMHIFTSSVCLPHIECVCIHSSFIWFMLSFALISIFHDLFIHWRFAQWFFSSAMYRTGA